MVVFQEVSRDGYRKEGTDSRKLSDKERYRVRQGPYRIVYSVSDKENSVVITKIGHRREIYRR